MLRLSRPYHGFLATALLLALLLAVPRPAAAQQDSVEAKVREEQKKAQRLQKGIEEQKSKVRASSAQEGGLVAELEQINRRIQAETDKLAALEAALDEQEQRLAAKQEELTQAKKARRQAGIHLRKRLNAFYRMGPIGIMNATFGSQALPELLSFREYFDAMLRHDREVIEEYRRRIEALETAQLALQEEKKVTAEKMAAVKTQQTELNSTRQERAALLEKVKTEKRLYQQALKELEDAAGKITSTIAALKAEAEREAKRKKAAAEQEAKRKPGGGTAPPKVTGTEPVAGTGFAGQKGKLPPPAPGTVTTLFGKSNQARFGITTTANGIDIKTEPGSEISAVHAGRVVYAGVLRGYGNLLIIDHGDQYYSLVSRAAKFFKKVGDTVSRGERIGVMADQEGLLGEGLHFEIRRGTQPEDPLRWLNNAGLTIKSPGRRAN
ncbi:MAG: murein hydrolase activator EnvC family protein [Thermodesulfobacteriota bacterium]